MNKTQEDKNWISYKCPKCGLEYFFDKEKYKEIPERFKYCHQCEHPVELKDESRSRF